MAELPDPTDSLSAESRATYEQMASVRAHAEGRATLGQVYVRMFNNPGVAAKVGAFGGHIRFHATLPDDIRELTILRFASRRRFGYEWSHHQRPAQLAGIDENLIRSVTDGEVSDTLDETHKAVLRAVDAVVAQESIPAEVQQTIVDAHGTAGIVELVAICGLYAMMGYMTTAFDIGVEEGLPTPPF